MDSINGISHYLNKCQTLSNTSHMTISTARRNARIASAVLATTIPSDRLYVRLSVTRRYCIKTTARSTVSLHYQIAKCV